MKWLVVVAIGLSSLAFAGGGDGVGNGGDNPPGDEGAAWFLGYVPIQYCIQVSEKFGIGKTEATSIVETAFKTWKDYIESHHLNDSEFNDTPFYNDQRSPVGRMPLLGSHELLNECNGNEELVFYLGVENETIKKYKAEYHRPTAFAKKLSYDGRIGRGKGFVWIANEGALGSGIPNWKLPYRLQGMVLHEIGHVLGTAHVKGTIMEDTMGSLVLANPLRENAAKSLFTQIDGTRELYYCWRCNSQFDGDVQYLAETPESFKFLVGRSPKGAVSAKLTDIRPRWSFEHYVLTVKDSSGEYEFPIEHQYMALGMVFGDSTVFKKAMVWSDKNLKWLDSAQLASNSMSMLRSLTTKTGKKVQIVLNRNMGASAVSIQLLDERNSLFLFVSDRPSLD